MALGLALAAFAGGAAGLVWNWLTEDSADEESSLSEAASAEPTPTPSAAPPKVPSPSPN
ncbi:hypothetical protein GRI89_05750 [Altererythrobacter salegens]|uniref:Uncharacterized protein n=1 Tax=Croceibacterium salegens TaxID=1737568 RepID=A0A6I4SSR7_9SPHN|nr:hypothetical protein [Croceibacterium salegens]MXO59041.1 hypothetical protein [Croceibacterium salegens]